MWAHPVKCTACTNCFRRLPEWQYSPAPLGSLRFYRQSLRCFFSLKGGSWPQQCVLGAWAIPHTAILKALVWSSGASGFLCSLEATLKATRWQPCTETLLGCVTKTLVLLRRCLLDGNSKKNHGFLSIFVVTRTSLLWYYCDMSLSLPVEVKLSFSFCLSSSFGEFPCFPLAFGQKSEYNTASCLNIPRNSLKQQDASKSTTLLKEHSPKNAPQHQIRRITQYFVPSNWAQWRRTSQHRESFFTFWLFNGPSCTVAGYHQIYFSSVCKHLQFCLWGGVLGRKRFGWKTIRQRQFRFEPEKQWGNKSWWRWWALKMGIQVSIP